jgi:site-specific DNA-methyltransferase (cytosine-N4-specific)
VLRKDGVLWLVLGDASWGTTPRQRALKHSVLKPKDLIGLPWRVALALQADGWYLRADVIWAKPNPMPDPVGDRPSRSHEFIFLLSKSRNYYYNADAIAEPAVSAHPGGKRALGRSGLDHGQRGVSTGWNNIGGRRNRRDVWQLKSDKTEEAHYAAFPSALVRLCLLAGSRLGDLILDPFAGSGTVGEVCSHLSRRWVGVELSAEHAALARRRTAQAGLSFKESIDP